MACCVVQEPVIAEEPAIVSQHTREFQVSVDDKPRGTQIMTFTRRSNGSETMRGETDVLVKVGVIRYRFASKLTEVWKEGRLIQLASEATFNGDKYVLQGAVNQQALHYEVNGEARQAPANIWVASYWREPDPRRVGQKINLLNANKGHQLSATLEQYEPDTITVGSKEIKASHYRLSGDVEVDVWYDKQGYIVRQILIESGHRTLLELTKVHQGGAIAARPEERAFESTVRD